MKRIRELLSLLSTEDGGTMVAARKPITFLVYGGGFQRFRYRMQSTLPLGSSCLGITCVTPEADEYVYVDTLDKLRGRDRHSVILIPIETALTRDEHEYIYGIFGDVRMLER